MAVLEQVISMKEQGISDRDIVNELSQNGISPKEISEALGQAQIKYSVSNPGDEEQMQPSIMPGENVPQEGNGQVYVPGAYEQQGEYPVPEYQEQGQYAPEYSQQQYYQPTTEQYSSAGIDANTVMEIADQVFSERIRKIQEQTETTAEASVVLQAKMENISDRLKKIETIIDKLQIAILEKVGSYGKNLESVKKEMSMMQDSFSKMISSPKRQK
jgi:hypothetical protein